MSRHTHERRREISVQLSARGRPELPVLQPGRSEVRGVVRGERRRPRSASSVRHAHRHRHLLAGQLRARLRRQAEKAVERSIREVAHVVGEDARLVRVLRLPRRHLLRGLRPLRLTLERRGVSTEQSSRHAVDATLNAEIARLEFVTNATVS